MTFYDGECGLCHGAVRFVLAEERRGRALLCAAPGGDVQAHGPRRHRKSLPDSFVVLDDAGELLLRSSAVVDVATHLAGGGACSARCSPSSPGPFAMPAIASSGGSGIDLFARPSWHCPFVPVSCGRGSGSEIHS